MPMNISPADALERLRAGNARYTANALTLDINDARRMHVVERQEPFAVILGCSDSRVPIEFVFDQGIGELFVIRVAGNVVQPSQIGSVEYAVQQFGVHLIVVLGHTGCGAVAATLDQLIKPEGAPSDAMSAIVSRIRPAVEGLLDETDGRDELLRHAVRENVRYATESLRHGSTVIESMVDSGDLMIVGAEYSLETGVVDFFDGMPM